MIARAVSVLFLAVAAALPAAARERVYSAEPSRPLAPAPQAAPPADLYRYDYRQPSAPPQWTPPPDHVHDAHCRHDLPPASCIVYGGLTLCQ